MPGGRLEAPCARAPLHPQQRRATLGRMAWSLAELTEAYGKLLEGPLAVQVASATERLEPRVSRAWGATFDAGGRLAFALIDAQTEELRRALGTTRKVAVNVTHPVTLESVQFKGDVVEIPEPDAATRAEADRRIAQFVEALRGAGILRGECGGLAHPGPARRVVMRVLEVFDQRPGPGAGRRVEVA